MNQFNPSSEIMSESQQECNILNLNVNICNNVYFLINGFKSSYFNHVSIFRIIFQRVTSLAFAFGFLDDH